MQNLSQQFHQCALERCSGKDPETSTALVERLQKVAKVAKMMIEANIGDLKHSITLEFKLFICIK